MSDPKDVLDLRLLGNRMDAMTAELRDFKLRVGRLETRIGGLEMRFGALENRFGAIEARMSGLENGMATLEERVSALLAVVVNIARRVGVEED